MSKRKTIEEIKLSVFNLVGDEYTVLDNKYTNNKTPIKFKHNKCGYEFYMRAGNFINSGNRCPLCNSGGKRDTKWFSEQVKKLSNGEYKLESEYISTHKNTKIKHLKCNQIFEVTPNNFIFKNNRCPYCSKYRFYNKGDAKFKKEVYDLVGDEYTVLDSYINNATKIKFRHNICGYEYLQKPNYFLQGYRCAKCSKRKKKNSKEFKKEVYDLVGDEYTVLGKYINTDTVILFKHIKCNKNFKMRPSNFLRGQRCPYCKESKGEKRIANYLDKLSVSYKREESFKDLYYKDKNHPLRFDFRIYCDNENIILIEYDGEQHINKNSRLYKYNNETFEIQKLRDKMKDDYVMSHDNICLYRIDYTEFDKIEECIDEILNDNKNIIFQK
jgi:DNA-directed RNA polymerase subunit RPC12/RpoP